MRAYIGIGSNIEPERHVPQVIRLLEQCFRTIILSPVYRCEAIGFDGPDFVNLVVGVDTELEPLALAQTLRDLEAECGRDRNQPGDSRTMDLDLLLYGDLVSDHPALRLPRDDIHRYDFVLRPLADIAAAERHPQTGQTFAQMWQSWTGDRANLRPAGLKLA
jgi:2-amino-4-hydroxy-6-hydroxymethyldihydropteridine diphosphokinase